MKFALKNIFIETSEIFRKNIRLIILMVIIFGLPVEIFNYFTQNKSGVIVTLLHGISIIIVMLPTLGVLFITKKYYKSSESYEIQELINDSYSKLWKYLGIIFSIVLGLCTLLFLPILILATAIVYLKVSFNFVAVLISLTFGILIASILFLFTFSVQLGVLDDYSIKDALLESVRIVKNNIKMLIKIILVILIVTLIQTGISFLVNKIFVLAIVNYLLSVLSGLFLTIATTVIYYRLKA